MRRTLIAGGIRFASEGRRRHTKNDRTSQRFQNAHDPSPYAAARDRSSRLLGDALGTLPECMTQEAQRPNPNADNITPVRHWQSPTKSGCRSSELTVPVKYEEAYERARNVAENNQTKS
jgi:hypothetical protein